MAWNMLKIASIPVVLAVPTQACDVALMLAVDVSGSVDPQEYHIQMDGLAAALSDSLISEALVRAQAQVSVMQWTGSSRQRTTIPWVEIRDFEDVAALADQVATGPRIWRNFSTAIGEALEHGMAAFAEVPQCKRHVIDVSGDGISNEGRPPEALHATLRANGVIVNALVIERHGTDLTGYFWEKVIVGEGAFVVTADSYDAYPARMKRKLLREVTNQLAQSD